MPARIRSLVGAVAVPVVCGLLLAPAAGAQTIREYPLPGATGPRDIVSGPEGSLWVTVDRGLVALRPTGETRNVASSMQPYAIAAGPAGTLWFAANDEETDDGEGDGTLGRVGADGSVSGLTGGGLDAPAALRDVVAGPDGTAVYVSGSNGGLGVWSEGVDEDGNPDTSYDFTAIGRDLNGTPSNVAAGPDGSYWYTAIESPNAIGTATFGSRDDEYAATYREVTIPRVGLFDPRPDDIVAGADGGMWFTLPFARSIGRVDVATGALTTYAVSATSVPTGITRGPDNAIWFTDAGPVAGIGRLDPVTKAIVVKSDGFSTLDAAPKRITTGPDGALWFTAPGSNTVGRVDPATFLGLPAGTEPPTTPAVPGTPPAPGVPVATPAPAPSPPPAASVPVTPPGKAPSGVRPAARFSGFSYGVRVRAPRRARVSFRLSRAATVRVDVDGSTARTIASVTRSGRSFRAIAGLNRLTLPVLAPGLHTVRLRATVPGGRATTLRARVRVLPSLRAAPSFTG